MFNLIPQIILFLAVGVIVVLIAKNISKVKRFPDEKEEIPEQLRIPRESKFLKKIPVEKINDEFNRLLEKFIRKVRIVMMRTDTRLQKRLESLKDSAKPKTIFKVEERVEESVPDAIIETEMLIEEESSQGEINAIGIGQLESIDEVNDSKEVEESVISPIIEEEAGVKLTNKEVSSPKRRKKKGGAI